MARVLVIHHDTAVLRTLAELIGARHEFVATDNLLNGVKYIPKVKPEVIVVGCDKKKREGLRLLRHLRDNQIKVPVVVVLAGGGGEMQPALMKLGARRLLEHPVGDGELDRAIAAAVAGRTAELAGPRPITDEELNSNLSLLEASLNRKMRCFAGKNKVYLQSTILGGSTTKPRIALRCPLRAEYGLSPLMYYEFIRDICCGDPSQCEAIQRFNAERESA